YRPAFGNDDASSRGDGVEGLADGETPRYGHLSADRSGPWSDCDRYRPDGHTENRRCVYLRRLQRQSEITNRRSREFRKSGRAIHAGESSWFHWSAQCRGRIAGNGFGTGSENVE